MKWRTASSFGYQSIEPVNTRRPGTSSSPRGAKYAVSTPLGTAHTVAPGEIARSRSRSACETAIVSVARAHARAS